MKHERHYRSTGGGSGFNRFRIAPYFQIFVGLLILAAVIGFLYYVVYPLSFNLAKGISPFASPTPVGSTPIPSPTPSPTPDPAQDHPLYRSDLTDIQKEIVIPEYQYLADPFIYDGKIFFSVGNYTQDGTSSLIRLCTYDPSTDSHSFLSLPVKYKSIRFPCINDKWITYLDAASSGGGRIVAYDRMSGQEKTLKIVHFGMPQPFLMNNIVIWMERTGQNRDKLFACDIETGESVTLEIFEGSEYGMSTPCVYEDTVYYVSPEGKLTAWNLPLNEKKIINTDTYVHDPKCNGKLIAYLSGNHGEDCILYMIKDEKIIPVAEGVHSYYLGQNFISYNRYDKNYVYFPVDGTTFCTTRNLETSMLLGAGENILIWMDVTWRDKDICEYMYIN